MAVNVSGWLAASNSATGTHRYQHTLFVENAAGWPGVEAAVTQYFKEAHSDAIEHRRALAGPSLHPAGPAAANPNQEYPWVLPDETVQGFFGEVAAGMLAPTAAAGGHTDWEVPCHLFRFQLIAFQQLEQWRQSTRKPKAFFGRTGDDCLAFRRDASGAIVAVLYCESKCTCSHQNSLIADAHEKASESAIVDVLQLIEILKSKQTAAADDWVNALRVLNAALSNPSSVTRCDVVCYVHGQTPKQKSTWISASAPHNRYKAGRPLDVFEVRLADVRGRVRSIYRREVW